MKCDCDANEGFCGGHNEPIPQIEYTTAREAEAALEGFEKGKREGFRLAREQIIQEIGTYDVEAHLTSQKYAKHQNHAAGEHSIFCARCTHGLVIRDFVAELAIAIARGKTE